MFLALDEEIPTCLLPQPLQGIELLIEELGSTAHPSFGDLAQPFAAVARCVYGCTGAGNTPASIQCLNPIHHPREVFGEGEITARQLLQRSYAILSMVDRPEKSATQQLSQFLRINPVTLVAFFQQSIPAWIAHYDLGDVWLQQVKQPGGPGSFFKSDMQVPAQPFHKLKNGGRLRFDDRLHNYLPSGIHHRDGNRFFVHVQADILDAVHIRVSLSVEFCLTTQKLPQRGALL